MSVSFALGLWSARITINIPVKGEKQGYFPFRSPSHLHVFVSLKECEKSDSSSLRHARQEDTITASSLLPLPSACSGSHVVVPITHDAATVEDIGVCTPNEQEVHEFL